MNTRGRNISNVDIMSNKKDAATNTTSTDEEIDDTSDEQVVQIAQPPVFNIHIHVPRAREGNSTMYLPRIQPIIHIHFDELAKKLRRSKANRERNFRVIRSALNQSTPNFGNVSVHYEDISHNRNFTSDSVNVYDQKCEQSQERISNIDSITYEKTVMYDMKGSTSTSSHRKTPKRGQISSNSTNISNELSTEKYQYNSRVKLKEAVVVLEDICKSKAYKDGVFCDVKRANQENKVMGGSSNSELHDIINSIQVKCENISTSCDSFNSQLNGETNELRNGGALNSRCEDMKQCESMSAEVGENKNISKRESLAALLDGCNFSELLNRFREKHDYLVGSGQKSEVAESENESENKRSPEMDYLIGQNNVNVKEEPVDDSVHDAEENWEEQGVEESEPSMNRTSEAGPHSLPSPCKRRLNAGELEMYDSDSSNEHTFQEFSRAVDPDVDSAGARLIRNSIIEAHSDSDNTVISSNSCSELDGELGDKHLDSFHRATINKSQFDYLETDNSSKYESTDSKLTEKELNMTKHRNRTKDSVPQKDSAANEAVCSPSPKKSKQSPSTTKKSIQKAVKSHIDDGYIPLNSSGPTKFSVANLSDVQPYKTHDAKNFKNEMLYGDRIRRFTASNHLQIYKMKKKASPGNRSK